jgi:CheY-like chemotaxis protein
VLLVITQPAMVGLIKLTLDDGIYVTRSATSSQEAAPLLGDWQPHLVLFDYALMAEPCASSLEPSQPAALDCHPSAWHHEAI